MTILYFFTIFLHICLGLPLQSIKDMAKCMVTRQLFAIVYFKGYNRFQGFLNDILKFPQNLLMGSWFLSTLCKIAVLTVCFIFIKYVFCEIQANLIFGAHTKTCKNLYFVFVSDGMKFSKDLPKFDQILFLQSITANIVQCKHFV